MVAKQRDDENESGTTRTTLAIGNDALRLLRREAEVSGHTEDEIVTDLILEALTAVDPKDDEVLPPYAFPRRAGEPPVTMELVNRLRDELL